MASSNASFIMLSNRKPLINGVRQALGELKFSGPKHFCEEVSKAIAELRNCEEAVVLLDWDFGIPICMSFFKELKEISHKEFFAIFIVSSKESEKIVAAGMEFGVARIHTGPITPVKVRLLIDELRKEIRNAGPLKTLLSKINEARARGDWPAATALLENVHKKDAKNMRVLFELAENYLQEKEYLKAYGILQGHLNANPPDTRILHAAGKALFKLGKLEEAASVMEKADFINPHNTERLINFGNILLALDRTKEAEDTFNRVKALDPKNNQATQGLGKVKLVEGDINEALKIMKDVVTGGELASVFNTSAVLSMRLGRFEKGIGLYEAAEKVLNTKPKILARILYNKGLGFFKWKKVEEARKCFEEALKRDATFENAKHNLRALNASTQQQLAAASDVVANSSVADLGSVKFDDSMGDVFDDQMMDEDERI